MKKSYKVAIGGRYSIVNGEAQDTVEESLQKAIDYAYNTANLHEYVEISDDAGLSFWFVKKQ